MDNSSIMFDMPFDPVVVTYGGNTVTATSDACVDVWEKVD